jgi:succinate-semialdehyde dehydrogenase/glutarate-semialdehyde dehydrogenase
VQKNPLIKTEAFVNGKWTSAGTGKTFNVINPATAEIIAAVPDMNREDVRFAIDSAHEAWPSYRALTAHARAGLLKKWYTLIIEHKED